ncbi:hypothetical protein E3T32_03950 [Cryobacterium sp. TMT2-23]|nr:hypothetical protein E3T32_03950 [Cryobacterium sp. TMT2-23]
MPGLKRPASSRESSISDVVHGPITASKTACVPHSANATKRACAPPSKAAIFQARRRLGFEPVRDLFARVAHPLAGLDTPGSWLAGRRLMSIDGTILDLADSTVMMVSSTSRNT